VHLKKRILHSIPRVRDLATHGSHETTKEKEKNKLDDGSGLQQVSKDEKWWMICHALYVFPQSFL